MSEPIVFISHFKVKDGKLEGLKQHSQMMADHIQANKPGTVVFLQYFNEDKTELSIVHVFSDAEAYDQHVEGVIERARAGLEFIERVGIELYGTLGSQALAMFEALKSSGVAFMHMPKFNTGYLRLMQG